MTVEAMGAHEDRQSPLLLIVEGDGDIGGIAFRIEQGLVGNQSILVRLDGQTEEESKVGLHLGVGNAVTRFRRTTIGS